MNTQELMNQEILTAEERNFLTITNPEWVKKYLFHHSWNNTYLNLEVYSEVDHDKRQLEMELGYSLKDLDVEGGSMYQDWEKEQYLKEEFGGTW
jgi:hypothetical protein